MFTCEHISHVQYTKTQPLNTIKVTSLLRGLDEMLFCHYKYINQIEIISSKIKQNLICWMRKSIILSHDNAHLQDAKMTFMVGSVEDRLFIAYPTLIYYHF